MLTGGEAFHQNSGLEHGYYIQPTIFKGNNKMRVFQEEIFEPVTSVTTFKTVDEAIQIGNDTLYGLGAGVWTRMRMRCTRFQELYKPEEFGLIIIMHILHILRLVVIKNLVLEEKLIR